MRFKNGVVFGIAGALAALTTLAAVAQTRQPGEWPQWRGPDRTGISQEKGLLKSWPAGGPRLVWKATGLGGGYSTPSIAGGRLYGMGYRDTQEVVWAYDAATGREVWSLPVTTANREIGYNEGSRCTPTVDGDRLYAVGVSGDLLCLERATGKVRWRKNLVSDFGGKIPNWGYTESPLIDGDKVIVTPGGAAATLVALDKNSGEVIWKSQVPDGNAAAYASAIVADVDGQRQYIQYITGGLVGVAAKDGKLLWRYNKPANGIVITTPIYHDNHVFATTAYGKGGGVVRLATTPSGMTATEVYFDPEMQNHHGGVVRLGEHIYYFEGWHTGRFVCREFKTGKLVWSEDTKRKGSLVYADGRFYVRNERGPVTLVEATHTGHVETGAFDQPERTGKAAWAHPVVAGGRLYLRDQDFMLCYDVKQP